MVSPCAGARLLMENLKMKTIVLLMIGAATLFVTAGCEDEHHEHHEHSGGTYDGNYHSYGYEHGPAYPARDGYWDSYGVWHPR